MLRRPRSSGGSLRSFTASIIDDRRSSGCFVSGFSDLLEDDDGRLNPLVSAHLRNRDDDDLVLRASRVAMPSDPNSDSSESSLQASGGLSRLVGFRYLRVETPPVGG